MQRRILKTILPTNSKRRKIAKKIYGFIKPIKLNSASYSDWIRTFEPTTLTKKTDWDYHPLISILVPAYNTPEKYLIPLLDSVISQSYQNWELILVQGGSPDPSRAKAIRKAERKDKRIHVVELDRNAGIAGNTNAGLKAAKGEYVGFLDHDDTLAPFALNEVVVELNSDKSIDVFYSDEDKLSDDGMERSLPFFKPDWSPELFRGVNYLAHFIVVRKSIVDKIGGIREGFDGAQDFDFLLRVFDQTNKIKHIPKILYHWRMADGSTARSIESKDYASDAGQRALADYLKRNSIDASVVEVVDRPTNYRLKYAAKDNPKVSIIIPFKDKVDLLKVLISSIHSKTNYKNYELILVSNNSIETETHSYLNSLADKKNIQVIEHNQPFNYSRVNNVGRKKATGSLLLFLNNDMEVQNPEWLEELVGIATQPGVGVVGAQLLYPDNRIQHAGVVLGMGGMAGHVFRFLSPENFTFFGLPAWPRNYLSVTGACTMVSAELFDQVGGYDENFTICGSDVALCLKIYETGRRNVYWPFAKLTHFESVSVGSYDNIPPSDFTESLKYYKPYMSAGDDPYFNINLDLANEQIGLRTSNES